MINKIIFYFYLYFTISNICIKYAKLCKAGKWETENEKPKMRNRKWETENGSKSDNMWYHQINKSCCDKNI